MSEIEVATVVNTAVATNGTMEKAGFTADIKSVAPAPTSPINEGHQDSNNQPPQSLAENKMNRISAVNAGSNESKDKKDVDQEEGGKSDGSVAVGKTSTLDELKTLLKKVDLLKKKLEEEYGMEFDEPEEVEAEEELESEAEEELESETEEESEAEEKQPEEPFEIEKHVEKLPSDDWSRPDTRTVWTTYTGAHTLVVSMKSSGTNLFHPPSASTVKDHTTARVDGVSIMTSAVSTIHTPPEWVLKDASEAGISKEGKGLDNDFANCRPDRVAIVCPTLLAEINRITGANLTTAAKVLLPPFKILVSFHDEFHESLHEKEAVSKKLLEEKSALRNFAPKPTANETEETQAEQEINNADGEVKLSADKELELKQTQKLTNGLKCLLHFMDLHLYNLIEVHRQIKKHMLKEIEFDHLWYLFKAGDVIITRYPKDQAYRVLHVGGGRVSLGYVDEEGKIISRGGGPKKVSSFFIDCYRMDFNGTHYGPVSHQVMISPYEGTRPITALEAIPISFLPRTEEGTVEDILVARGKKFVKLARVTHKKYKGLNLREGNFRHEEVDGDTIIDFALAFKDSKPPYEIEPPSLGGGVIDEPTPTNPAEIREGYSSCGATPPSTCHEEIFVYDDTEFDLRRRTEFKDLVDTNNVLAEDGKLGKDRHKLLPYRVYGYVLLSRKWYPLDIDLVKDVKETTKDAKDGFSDLVLPEDHKQIVRALVKTHARGPRSTSSNKTENMLPHREIDLVKGKGKGLIILLHGVPGVGKTSTAECVATNTNRPLFPITCGDIGGTTAKEVETNLESYFDLARKWGCVLLLDEADVFLGERTKGDIVQNSLVSVFLRVLEYYSGILILTTNRVGQFDEAIKSRIHISLYYPPLTRKSSLEIWKMNLDRLERRDGENQDHRPIIFSRKEIMKFSKEHWANNEPSKTNWNGRQIKNAFQTAIALAEWDFLDTQSNPKLKSDAGPLLEARHFQKVAEASARFDQYLNSVRNSDVYNAKSKNNRRDDFVDTGVVTDGGLRFPNLQEAKNADRARRGRTPQPESDEDQNSGYSTDSLSDISDDDYKMKKREMELMRIKKEEQQRQKAEAEKLGKRKLKEQKKTQQREEQEAKMREQALRRKEAEEDSDDSG